MTTDSIITTSLLPFGGGVDPVAAVGPVKRILLQGTWAAEDRITLTVIFNYVQYDLGIKHVTGMSPTFVMAYKNQIMFCAGDEFVYSGIDEPTGFEDRYSGYGYIEMSGERGEALQCIAAAPYAGKIALFAKNNVQLWLPNADPAEWQLVQSLENVGTCSPLSVVSYGELDVFFLSHSGIRSLRVRESTDLVNVQDVGSSLDVYLQSIIHGLSDAVLLEAYGWYSSKDGRYWLYLNGDFYVFSYFPGTRISAWTKYGTSVVDESSLSAYTPKCFTTSNGYLYMLGQAADGYVALVSYPSSASYRTTAYLTLPFYDMKSPGSLKHFKAIDIAGTGTWKVEVGNNPNDITSFTTLVAALPLSTHMYNRVPLGFHASHALLRLTHTADSTAAIASLIWHWEMETHR